MEANPLKEMFSRSLFSFSARFRYSRITICVEFSTKKPWYHDAIGQMKCISLNPCDFIAT